MQDWKILVVDDQKEIRENLEKQLLAFGYQVHVAKNRMETDFLLKRYSFDIAILDIMLPDGNGIEIYRDLKQKNDDVYAIMITGNATVENTIEALNEGVNAYMVKPFSNDQLRAHLIQANKTLELKAENVALFQEIQKNRQFYENLLNSTSEGILLVDLDFKIHYCNKAAIQLLNTPQEQLLQESLNQYLEDGYKVLSHIYQQLTLGRTVAGYRVGIIVPDKKVIDAHLTADFLHDNLGRIEGLIINLSNTMIHSDLFNRMLRKEKLSTIIHLANALAHEIRNPINILYGRLQLLAEEMPDENFQRSYKSIKRQIDRLLDVTGLLGQFNFSKEDSIPEVFPAENLLKSVLADRQATLESKHLTLQIKFEGKPPMIEASQGHLLNAVGYLFDAIIEYTPAKRNIDIRCRRTHAYTEHPWTEFYIKIPKSGMTPDQILDPYKGTDLKANGLIDMGLTIMHTILNNYGVKFEAFQQNGEGLVLRLQFPAPEEERNDAGRETPNEIKNKNEQI